MLTGAWITKLAEVIDYYALSGFSGAGEKVVNEGQWLRGVHCSIQM